MSKILIVQPAEQACPTLTELLSQQGHVIIRTSTGVGAVRLARLEHPQLVVLDHALPDLDGLTVCRIVRQELDLLVVLVLSRESGPDPITSLNSGADDCIYQPCSPEELAARVRAVLRRGRPAPMQTLQAGDLTVDLRSRRAFRREAYLELSRKEFDLLTELIRHTGIALKREALLERVWGGRQANTRTLDTHIYSLRHKIEDDPEHPHRIQTVRGVGYRFDG